MCHGCDVGVQDWDMWRAGVSVMHPEGRCSDCSCSTEELHLRTQGHSTHSRRWWGCGTAPLCTSSWSGPGRGVSSIQTDIAAWYTPLLFLLEQGTLISVTC